MADLVENASAGACLLALALVWIYHRFGRNVPFVAGLAFPHELHASFLGVAKCIGTLQGSERIFVDAANDDGLVSCRLVTMPVVGVLKAEHVRAVVCASSYRKPTPLLEKYSRVFLGDKSLTSLVHDEWKVHRRLVARAFHWKYLAEMLPAMASVAAQATTKLLAAGYLDVYHIMQLSALDTIALTGFGVDIHALRDNTHPIGEAFSFLLGEVSRRTFEAPLQPASYFYSIPTATNRRYHRESAVVRNTLNQIISERRANPGGAHPDLLQALLDASASETDPITPEMLIDNVVTFFFGGYDTTSTGMAYTLYLLAAYPDVQAKAVAEIDAVVGRGGKITYEVLQNLPYLNAVLTESLRLFPPLPATTRNLEKELTLGGYTVPAETTIFLSIWCINRSRLNWGDDVLEFKPERHLTTDANDDHMSAKDRAYRFMTFSGGPRNCVGMRFATLESTCMLVAILQQCVLTRPNDAPPIQPKLVGIVQKPELGVWLHVAPRPTPRFA